MMGGRSMRPGEIYLAQFPFGDVPGMKLRPVLLLTGPIGSVPEVLVAYISSVVPAQVLQSDILIDPAKTGISIHSSQDRFGLALAQTGDHPLFQSGAIFGFHLAFHPKSRHRQSKRPIAVDKGYRKIMTGTVDSIYIAPASKVPMRQVSSVRAVLGKGLEGDRYSVAIGTFSDQPGPSREVTLIEIEAIEAVNRDHQTALTPAESRRNILTRGIRLNDLVNREFRVGGAILKGIRLCEPCSHLESLTGKELLSPLVHRGGLRAQVIQEGFIQAGDMIEELPSGSKP